MVVFAVVFVVVVVVVVDVLVVVIVVVVVVAGGGVAVFVVDVVPKVVVSVVVVVDALQRVAQSEQLSPCWFESHWHGLFALYTPQPITAHDAKDCVDLGVVVVGAATTRLKNRVESEDPVSTPPPAM